MSLRGLALMAEVVGVLARHSHMRVTPEVEHDIKEDGAMTVTLTIHPTSVDDGLAALELYEELRCLLDTVQIRELAVRYDLSPDDLDPLLRKIHGAPRSLVAGAPATHE